MRRATQVGTVAVSYGALMNEMVNFLIVASALFVVVKGMNAAKKEEAKVPTAPVAPYSERLEICLRRDSAVGR